MNSRLARSIRLEVERSSPEMQSDSALVSSSFVNCPVIGHLASDSLPVISSWVFIEKLPMPSRRIFDGL
jgi:hypothetical protein